jgi:hypothetical protein
MKFDDCYLMYSALYKNNIFFSVDHNSIEKNETGRIEAQEEYKWRK